MAGVLNPPATTVVSRKDTCCVEISAVNLMKECNELIWSRKASSTSLPCSQMAKISSMYLHHVCGLADVQASSLLLTLS